MFWYLFRLILGIETKKEKAERKQQEENSRKMSDVWQKMLALNTRYQGMAPSAVIAELVAMHDFYEMPIYCFVGYYEVVLYPMLKYLGTHPALTANDALQIAKMLLWPEVKRFTGDASCRLAILGICERFPTDEVRVVLQQHLPYAQEQLEYEKKGYWRDRWYGTEYVLTVPAGGVGTHLCADLGCEVYRTSQLVGPS